jgi:hypothetical protein
MPVNTFKINKIGEIDFCILAKGLASILLLRPWSFSSEMGA